MGTVTAYNLNNIQSALGGSNPIGLNEYYRGGAYVPTTSSGSVREPATGQYQDQLGYYWSVLGTSATENGIIIFWSGAAVEPAPPNGSTSYTAPDGFTYYRGTFFYQSTGKFAYTYYGIYRTGTASIPINTGVPSSGTISIANLYGARNP